MDNRCNSNLLLVAGSRITQKNLEAQLRDFLPEEITITPCVPAEETPSLTGSYFAVFSSEETYQEFMNLEGRLDKHPGEYLDEYIVGSRTIINQNLDKLLTLPRDQDILLVSDSKDSAMETIRHLKNIGFGFLRLLPYYPGCGLHFNHITMAVTPGDAHQVPSGIDAAYNIGTRPFDLSTVIKLMVYYDVVDAQLPAYIEQYQNIFLDFAKRISNVADETSKIMKTVRRALAGTGYYAKYHFEDIIGDSPSIRKAKSIAEKIARTDLSILIEGDNGTGKELFASAIHNASDRAGQPFVAINFSALPDQLIESELFGYEEGAFTGAKKGGKAGLFQQASGGTIFLDEIGDVSPMMQAKLLRVLQEKEIMKVGGDRIIPVDVRIIAATNRNLKEMIQNSTFRQDLYYRLNEGFFRLPALDQRKQDIPLLLHHWQENIFDGQKTISSEVVSLLQNRNWPGNVRELFNVMKFAAAVCDSDCITPDNLPFDADEVQYAAGGSQSTAGPSSEKIQLPDETALAVLSAIDEIGQGNEVAGRNKIYWLLRTYNLHLSEYRIRQAISKLKSQGFIESEDGKYGLFLTEKGLAALKQQHRI